MIDSRECASECEATDHVAKPSSDARCPTNQQLGRPIDVMTLKALLALPLSVLQSPEYRFCRAPDCPTVYYSTDGKQVFQEADLREVVFQKHVHDEDTLVCYCFKITVGSIRSEIAATRTSTAITRVTAGIRAGLCACDIRNPQGSCCLGNVKRVIEAVTSDIRPSPMALPQPDEPWE